MIYNMTEKILAIIILFSAIVLHAGGIEISKSRDISIPKSSYVYFDDQNISLVEIIERDLFAPYDKPYLNSGISHKTIWIKFELINSTSDSIEKLLVFTSPLLEHIHLYSDGPLSAPITKGHAHIDDTHNTLYYSYDISIEPHSAKVYFVKVRSDYTPIDFSLKIEEPDSFYADDLRQQKIIILLIGFIAALMIFSLLLAFFIGDVSYLFYSIYLFMLLAQQMTYLGFTQIYFPTTIIDIDMHIPIIKINLLLITSALFSIYFLKMRSIDRLYTIYKWFIAISILEILFLSTSDMLILPILTGSLFIIFNLTAGFISYRMGNREARLFIVGFGIVSISYGMIILDAIGLTTNMQRYQNILMWGTAIEALILSLAFADRYLILQQKNKESDAKILSEAKRREDIISIEVESKTKKLNQALKSKELLIREIHHRVKNNLQVILSIIRLQSDSAESIGSHDAFVKLENRINAIAHTYTMLLADDDLEQIDMDEYLGVLFSDLTYSLDMGDTQVEISSEIDAVLSLNQAVSIGLVLNELITNSYKYAFDKDGGKISIKLHYQHDHYVLYYCDNGKGFDKRVKSGSLGLKLIESLINDQLDGKFKIISDSGVQFIIRFR